jgi:HK97 family phage major capsid protein
MFRKPIGLLLVAAALLSLAVLAIDPDQILAAAGDHLHSPGGAILANLLGASFGTTLRSLQEKRGELLTQMGAMIAKAETENRDLTAEEILAYDALKAEKDGLQGRISRAEELESSTALSSTVRPAAARGQGIVTPRGPEASREFESLGQFIAAVRFNPNDQRLQYVDENPAARDPETGEMRSEFRMDNNTSGGFMVPPQLRTTIMSVEPQAALVRPRANVIPAGSPPDAAVTIPALDQSGTNPANMFGGVEVRWIGEGEEKPETDADLKQITLTPHEVAGLVTVTDKLLRNWQAAGTFIENLLRGAVNAAEDYAFLRGTGVHQPLGAINASATKFINRAVANQVSYLDLLNMVARLLMRDGSPVWSMPQSALVQISTMTDPEGHYIWKPDARDGFAGTLLGYPVRWNNRAPALGSKGDILLADWSHYLIKDGSGPFVASSEHVKFTSNKTVIKIFWNVDGAPDTIGPIKEENGYEVSPFVGLDVPA